MAGLSKIPTLEEKRRISSEFMKESVIEKEKKAVKKDIQDLSTGSGFTPCSN
ncbi:hypothetical protein CHS0354_000323, partial [Potamilus streckersoni]